MSLFPVFSSPVATEIATVPLLLIISGYMDSSMRRQPSGTNCSPREHIASAHADIAAKLGGWFNVHDAKATQPRSPASSSMASLRPNSDSRLLTSHDLVCRLLLEKKNNTPPPSLICTRT